MENLRLLQKPLQPATLKSQIVQFLETTTLIDTGVMCKLGSFYKIEDNCILEPDQDGSDTFQGKRVPR